MARRATKTGEKIAKLLSKFDWTQEALARRCGVTTKELRNYADPDKLIRPTIDKALSIARALGVSPDTLFADDKELDLDKCHPPEKDAQYLQSCRQPIYDEKRRKQQRKKQKSKRRRGESD